MWVLKIPTVEHKLKRVECAEQFLASFEEKGDEYLDSIITGDVTTWVNYYTPEMKEQSKQWRYSNLLKAKKFKQEQSERTVASLWPPVFGTDMVSYWSILCPGAQQTTPTGTVRPYTNFKGLSRTNDAVGCQRRLIAPGQCASPFGLQNIDTHQGIWMGGN